MLILIANHFKNDGTDFLAFMNNQIMSSGIYWYFLYTWKFLEKLLWWHRKQDFLAQNNFTSPKKILTWSRKIFTWFEKIFAWWIVNKNFLGTREIFLSQETIFVPKYPFYLNDRDASDYICTEKKDFVTKIFICLKKIFTWPKKTITWS